MTPTTGPYVNYIDEAIFFARDPGIVNSFREKFDDFWTDTTNWANYANISGALTRYAPDGTYAQDSQLNFPPDQNYRSRAVSRYSAARTATNGRGVDVIMYRITDRAHSDAMINLEARGVPVRLITEQAQYRLVDRMWHAWNVDRMYMAGVQIRDRAACRAESPEERDHLRSGHRSWRPDDGDFRLVQLDEPVSERPGRTQHVHHAVRPDHVVHRPVQPQVGQPGLLARNQAIHAASAGRAEEPGARQRRDRRSPRSRRWHGSAGHGPISTMSISALTSTR